MNKEKVKTELNYIEEHFDFSYECTGELKDYILGNYLVKDYDGTLMLTPKGDLYLGLVTEDEMKELNDDNDDSFFLNFHYQEGETNDDYDF